MPPIPDEAQDAPIDDGAGVRAPLDVIETSRKRSAEDAGQETDDADRAGMQPGRGSMADDSMQEAQPDAGALGADAVALAEAYSPARFQQRAGAFGEEIECCEATPAHYTKPDRLAELLKQGRHPLGICLQSGRIAGRVRWTRSLRTSLGGDVVERTMPKNVVGDQWHAQGPMRSISVISVDDAGNVGLARKASGFITNDEYIAEAVDRRCFGGHDHIQLLSGRGNSCEKYPPRLVAVILRALRQSMRAAGRGEAQRMMGRDRQSQQWRLGRLWRSRSCCRSLTARTVLKSSGKGAQDCCWTLRWSREQESLKCNTWMN